MSAHPVILYDGVCGLCNRLVRFVLKRDRREVFRFAALQSGFAQAILLRQRLSPQNLDTMYLVKDCGGPEEELLARSDAGLDILRRLGGLWSVVAAAGRAVPLVARNFLYNFVARNRYRIFGKYDACPLPNPEQRARFLDS